MSTKLLLTIFRDLAVAVLKMVGVLVPKRDSVVLSGFPDTDDQVVALLRQRHARTDLDRIEWTVLVTSGVDAARAKFRLVLGPSAATMRIVSKWSLAGFWAFLRARYVMSTHGLFVSRVPSSRQVVVNLWHGMPIKRIWRGVKDSPVPPCTWLLSTSAKYTEILSLASGLAPSKIPVLGLPRNDLLFSRTNSVQHFGQSVRQGVSKALFFLPTYRQRHNHAGHSRLDGTETASVLGMTAAEAKTLRTVLADSRLRLLVKPHPMSIHYGVDEQIDDHLWIISDDWLHSRGLTLYEALGQMDGLITDISSIYIDFLILRRPVFFYFPDLCTYRQTRSFLLEPVEDWLAGPLCTTTSELTSALVDFSRGVDLVAARRQELATMLNPQTAPHAADRLFTFLGWSSPKFAQGEDVPIR